MSVWFITPYNREQVVAEIVRAPAGARVTITDGPPRSNPQNKLMWRLLGCFADQVVHGDRKYDAETWKAILLKAFGRDLSFVPSLDGAGVVALGYRSSLLTKEEMSNFIEFIYSEGVKIGVAFEPELIEPEARKALPA